MEMKGEQLLPVPQQQAWDALNDPAILRDCIPGCESVERVSETEFQLAMTTAIGPVKGKFKGKLTLADVDAPRAYTLQFEGQGGLAGFAKGGATVADIQLMRLAVGPEMGVKASGGIRSLEDLRNMASAGATRIGASASVKIVEAASSPVGAPPSKDGY